MSLNITERMATGWFLAINQGERKRIAVTDVRCSRGCVLAAVVTIDRALYVLGVTDSTRTETHPSAMRDKIDEITGDTRPATRLTRAGLDALTVGEFLQGFRARPRAFSTRDLAAVDTGHRHGWLDEWQAVKAGDKRVRGRCRHLDGYVPAEAFNLDKRSVRVSRLDKLDDLV